MREALQELSTQLAGSLKIDDLHKAIYATDASVYRKIPLAVAFPQKEADIVALCAFAKAHHTHLIARTAGTSLAGQCVGDGIVVDVSKHFTSILHFDHDKRQVTVQPGVIRDELNSYLEPHGLFFGPNTSTANRCMIGGMVGNNSSGTTSIQYGVTRDKVVRLKTILSDGSTVVFEPLSPQGFRQKCALQTLEGVIYRTLLDILQDPTNASSIAQAFPKKEIHRRNTGYALDALLEMQPFSEEGALFNVCALLAGSEGTLAFTTEITLQLDPLPPAHSVVVAAHFDSIEACMKAVVPAMQHNLYTCEMMDKVILDCTKNNRDQLKNRFFVTGDPKAILLFEVRDARLEGAREKAASLITTLQQTGLSYAYPKLEGKEINQALELRKAGLGLLGNMIGDRKAVACIEDTAVALDDLSAYISEFTALMERYGQDAVYYAHAGAGEIHLRPLLNLKDASDVDLFKKITTDVAHLVRKYKGSLSGEHGDGIVRSAFLELMIGKANYTLLKRVKYSFDPHNIFNTGKIIDALPMDANLRYLPNRKEPEITTLFDFSKDQGILRSAEKCNGSGDCRKLPEAGGAMCPSYHATRNEKDTTRARANALREFLTHSDQSNRFNHKELKEVFDLCLSCKACASECPSNVDIATLKAEFEYQYQQENGSTLRTRLFAHNTRLNRVGSKVPMLYNVSLGLTGGIFKRLFGIAKKRSLPALEVFKEASSSSSEASQQKVFLYIDEFSQFLDGSIAQDAHLLLVRLGYQVTILKNLESGRAYISKGFLDQAKKLATKNVRALAAIPEHIPVLGIEPSALYTFKDEYLKLADDKEAARRLAERSFLVEDFIASEFQAGNITSSSFTKETRKLKIHLHCHQKALGDKSTTFTMLNIPENYRPTLIPSGCCGMAGSFGYEKEHYDISMQVGEQTLFPAIRKAQEATIIVANGTSCRHQIKDGTPRKALHPVTVLRQALV